MKRILPFIIVLMILLNGCGNVSDKTSSGPEVTALCEQTVEQLHVSSDTEYDPLNYKVQSAIWFAVMGYDDILTGKTEKEFTNCIIKQFNSVKEMGINTVYMHVRAYNDAYYKSDIFPLGAYCPSGIDYDPLEIMVREGHKLNLSVHAWINPLRCQTDKQLEKLSNTFKVKQWYNDEDKRDKYIVNIKDRWYLNPAYEDVRAYIADGIREIVREYEVDGIHIDDYFYPTTNKDFDASAFKASSSKDLSSWRLENINQLVKEMYDAVKKENSNVLFGISPQGSINADYKSQYADVKKWASEEGYCDYIVPQIYFGFSNESCPFKETLGKWQEIKTCESVKLVAGICTYKIGKEDKWAGLGKNEWKKDSSIPARQAEYALEKKVDGVAVYSYQSTFEENLNDERESLGSVLRKITGE